MIPPEGQQDFLAEHPFDVVRSPLPESVLVEQASIPIRDGVMLAATVFRPRDTAKPVPVIATATPYGKDNYTQRDNFRDAPEGNVPGGGFYMGRVEISDHTRSKRPIPATGCRTAMPSWLSTCRDMAARVPILRGRRGRRRAGPTRWPGWTRSNGAPATWG